MNQIDPEQQSQQEQMAHEQAEPIEPVSPDTLLRDFRGRHLMEVAVITIIAHVVFIGVFSPWYLIDQVKYLIVLEDEEPTPEQKLELAVTDGNLAIREIADKYSIEERTLRRRLGQNTPTPAGIGDADSDSDDTNPAGDADGAGNSASDDGQTGDTATPEDTNASDNGDTGDGTTDQDDDTPLSDIEQKLQEQKDGPPVPDLDINDEEDPFAPDAP